MFRSAVVTRHTYSRLCEELRDEAIQSIKSRRLGDYNWESMVQKGLDCFARLAMTETKDDPMTSNQQCICLKSLHLHSAQEGN